jgi:arabinose-5-phosphate isomerase
VSLKIVQLESPIAEADDADASVLASAQRALAAQADALGTVAERLGREFCRAVDLLYRRDGRVVVCGVGKSGLIGKKIAATFACSGTPSLFVHAADAAHGDLGMIMRSDVLLLVSHSGATEELVRLLPHFRELGVPMIALVGDLDSPLARAADVAVCTYVEREICPHNVVVTTSALVTLAIADALALTVMRRRGVGPSELERRHPHGSLGRRLTRTVREVMQRDPLPLVVPELPLREALVAMAAARSGILVVIDAARSPLGVVTESELRTALNDELASLERPVGTIMSADPVTIHEDARWNAAEEKIRRLALPALVVVDAKNRVSGVLQPKMQR